VESEVAGFAKRYLHLINFEDVFGLVKEFWLVENSTESDFRFDLQCSRAEMLQMSSRDIY
jgi:hypothetical protein